jgi:two-component system chemotaxis sensor kinase CheA
VAGDHDLLRELRDIFREELADHLASLDRQREVLERADADAAAIQGAFAEVRRAFHSLKGAAGAVDYRSIEQLCHALETQLASAKHARDPAWVAAITAIAADTLLAWAGDLAAGRAPGAGALDAAQRSLASLASAPPPSRGLGLAIKAEAEVEIEARPGPEAAPSSLFVALPPVDVRATAPELRPAAERAPETVRVSPERLGELLSTSEEMLALAGRQESAAARWKPLDDALSELRDTLRRARQTSRAEGLGRVPGGEEVIRRVDRGLAVVQSLSAWSIDRQRDDAAAWRTSGNLAREIADRSRALRVVPFGSLEASLDRTAHDAGAAVGKPVEIRLRGGAIEIDRRVRDGLRDPLLHLIRNAVDHGLEAPEVRARAGKSPTGVVEIVASLAGRDLCVTVEDDGAGIDVDAVRRAAAARGIDEATASQAELFSLLYEPGFTTRGVVTPLSGRGVGLDIVRQRVAEMHGRVEVESRPGRGARFTVVVPFDLSIVRGLIVRAGDAPFVIVTTAIVRLSRVTSADLRAAAGRLYLQDASALIPLADLDTVLGLSRRTRSIALEDGPRPCVVLAAGDRRVALRVDALVEERDVVIRPLGARVRRSAFVSGATVIGDGEVAPVLDVADLVRLARPAPSQEAAATRVRHRVLVVDDSVTTRQLERSILEAAGYEVDVARDGQEAWELLAAGELFDLVVSDVEMPRLDGFQLVERVRGGARTARLPIVLVTARDSDADRRRALEVGASAYVVKGGFDQEALLDILEQLL